MREDQVIKPDGKQSNWGVVEMKPGVSILLVDHDDTVYLVRVYRYTIGRDSPRPRVVALKRAEASTRLRAASCTRKRGLKVTCN